MLGILRDEFDELEDAGDTEDAENLDNADDTAVVLGVDAACRNPGGVVQTLLPPHTHTHTTEHHFV
jgi:hypothetical protein